MVLRRNCLRGTTATCKRCTSAGLFSKSGAGTVAGRNGSMSMTFACAVPNRACSKAWASTAPTLTLPRGRFGSNSASACHTIAHGDVCKCPCSHDAASASNRVVLCKRVQWVCVRVVLWFIVRNPAACRTPSSGQGSPRSRHRGRILS